MTQRVRRGLPGRLGRRLCPEIVSQFIQRLLEQSVKVSTAHRQLIGHLLRIEAVDIAQVEQLIAQPRPGLFPFFGRTQPSDGCQQVARQFPTALFRVGLGRQYSRQRHASHDVADMAQSRLEFLSKGVFVHLPSVRRSATGCATILII